MQPEQLAQRVSDHFHSSAPRYGLQGNDVTVEYRSYGGSLHRRHFTISEGEVAYHLKLAHILDHLAKLRKWHSLGRMLYESHRAPRVVDWIDVPGTEFSGLLCEHIHGRVWDFGSQPHLAPGVIDMVHRLHEDEELQQQLRRFSPGGTCRDYFNGVWRRRIRRDLTMIEAQPPDFVSGDTLRWLRDESLSIERAVAGLEAFSASAASAVHGDLWRGNILLSDDGRLRIVDWDDLALGDPALEFAVLLEPIMELNPGASLEDLLQRRPDAGFTRRFETCLWAQRLYAPIEAAAEYIEAAALGMGTDHLRDEKEALHREALRAYTRRYGNG